VSEARRTAAVIGVVILLLAVVVLAQDAAAAQTPKGTSAQTGRLVGRAGFAYLSGVRTFAAAVLWNRLEPQFHHYYADRSLSEQVQMLPTIRLVQLLDPQLVQSYYVASWVLARHGDTTQGLAIAREGVEKNPSSGLLRASLIEVMLLEDKNAHRPEEVAQADAGMGSGIFWADDAEKLEGYAVFAATFRLAGLKDREQAARTVMASLATSDSVDAIGGAGHDHDGDGTPDH
jgi:surface antigen